MIVADGYELIAEMILDPKHQASHIASIVFVGNSAESPKSWKHSSNSSGNVAMTKVVGNNDAVTLAEKFRRDFDEDVQGQLFPEQHAYERYCAYCKMIGHYSPPSFERWKDIQRNLFGRTDSNGKVFSVNS